MWPECLCASACPVYVNTTVATAGATTLLLPAQNTHTLQDPKRDTEHARAGCVEDGLGVGVRPVCVPAPPGVFLPVRGLDLSRLPPVSFYR